MNNPDIRRYERELKRETHGFRCRKRILEAFRTSLSMLLEDVDSPSYDVLKEAFGPPERMAQELKESIPNLPEPLRVQQKAGIVIACCLLATVICMGVFYSRNMPESDVTVLDRVEQVENIIASSYAPFSEIDFSQSDFSWEQGDKFSGYLFLFENTNQVDTQITIKYSKHQRPHFLVVPAGEQRVFQVDDATSTEHSIAFSTSDGSMSGSAQLFFRLPS